MHMHSKKKSVILLSFATPDFVPYQRNLIRSAKKFGINQFITKTKKDIIQTDFFNKHNDIFKESRGFGYWLWKPYYILDTLRKMHDDQILFYADSGCEFLSDPSPLIEICKKDNRGVVAFDARPLTNAQWVKGDAFSILGLSDSNAERAYMAIATTILFRKNDFTLKFVSDWLYYCCNPFALTYQANVFQSNAAEFVEHKADQSILSLLVYREKINTYRNPSKWGNYLKLPEYRNPNEWIGYPYNLNDTISEYSKHPQENSPYGTIMEFNRKAHRPIKIYNVQSFKKTIAEKVYRFQKRFSKNFPFSKW